MDNNNYIDKYRNQIDKNFEEHNDNDFGNVYEEDYNNNDSYNYSEGNNYYTKTNAKWNSNKNSNRNSKNKTSIIAVLFIVFSPFLFLSGYYFLNNFKDKENKVEKELKELEESIKKAKELKEKYKQLSKETTDTLSKTPKEKEVPQKQKIKKIEPVIYKPAKDTWEYYRFSENQLIEEVKDSRINDYDYYDRDKTCTANEARDTLIHICKQMYFYRLLDEILTNGFAPKYTTATKSISLNSFVVEPVCSPVNANKEEFLNVLIKHNANLKAERLYDGYNLLHASAVVGNLNIAKIAIKAGIPINKTSKDGTTPIVLAIKNGFYELVKLFAENGAEIKPELCEYTNDRDILKFIIHQTKTEDNYDLDFESNNKQWEEAYDYIKNHDYESIKTLMDCGVDLAKMSYDGEAAPLLVIRYCSLQALKLFVNKFDCSKYKDSINGRNVLHYAVMFKRIELLKYLLKQDYDVNVPDRFGNTPLFYAVENRVIEYYKELLKYEADANFINNKKENPLFYAVKSNNTPILANLIRSGADVNQKDINGNTPILLAREKGFSSSESELIKHGADPNSLNEDTDYNKNLLSEQQVKLHTAVLDNDLDYLKRLLFECKTPDLANSKKQSALHLAVLNNNIKAVNILLEEGASINQPDEDGNTPLHYIAMYASNSEMLDTFYSFKDRAKTVFIPRTNTNYYCDYYFDFSLKNKEGKTPREICEPDCFKKYERSKGIKEKTPYTRSRASSFHNYDEESEKGLDYIPTLRKLKKTENVTIKRDKNYEAFLNKIKQNEFSKIYGNHLPSNTNKLLELRADFLKKDENALIEEFKKLNDFNKQFDSKSQENKLCLDIDKLFFVKIALDKDYSQLLQEILNTGFNLNYWKINYVPPAFYAADMDSQKCLKVLEDNNFNLNTMLSYVRGRPYRIYTNRLRADGDVLYHIRYIKANNRNGTDWGEIIMNLDDKVFNVLDLSDDSEIFEELDLGKTILHSAAQNGNIELAKKMMANGISVDIKTDKGNTPLFYAVKNNKHEMASFLISQGAKTNEKINKKAKDDQMVKILEKGL